MQKNFENFPNDTEEATKPLSQLSTLKEDTKMDIPKILTTKEKRKNLKKDTSLFFNLEQVSTSKISKVSVQSLNLAICENGEESIQNLKKSKMQDNELETLSLKLEKHFKPLEELLELIKIRFYNQPELHNKVLFLYHKACETSGPQNEVSKSLVSKLIFLIDKYPERINDIFKGNQTDIIKNMKNVFYQKILEIKESINQDNNNVPVILAEILWTSLGRLNTGIIKKLKTAFFPMKGTSKLHQKQMMLILDSLSNKGPLRKELLSINREHRDELQIDHAVRAQLSLSNSISITPLHLQKVALISLLSHPRQNQAGSCFASFLPISLLTIDPLRALKDLKCLLTKDCLEYTSPQNVITQIPYNMVISSEEMDKILRINSKGHFFSQEKDMGSLASLPGWLSVCRGLGIKDPEHALTTVIKKFKFTEEKGDILIKDLVMALCRSIGNGDNLKEVFALAKFYYKSATNPPLLACWENAIAAMCESQANSYLKSILANSLIPYVLNEFEKKISTSTLEDKNTSKLVINNLSSIFHRSTRLTYDPDAQGSEECVEGGFVLEVITEKGWKRIEDENDFLNFSGNILQKLAKSIQTSSLSNTIKMDLDEAINSIKKNIQTDVNWSSSWIIQITNRFKSILQNQIKNTTSINTSSPWSILVGHDADQVLQLYFRTAPKKIEFLPSNAEEAMRGLLLPQDKYSKIMATHQVQLPFRLQGYHACTLIDSPLNNGEEEDRKNIIENLKTIGEKISSNKISEFMQENIFKLCIKLKKNTEILNALQKIDKDLSIYDYRNKIMGIYSDHLEETSLKEFERKLDSALAAYLPTHLKKTWLSLVIPFADTNWHRGSKDIYFCFGYNLGTKKIDLWKVEEDNENIQVISTEKIFNTPWQIYYPPMKEGNDD